MSAEKGVSQEYHPGISRRVSEINKIKTNEKFHQIRVGITVIQFL
jgi:hypothetical protein